MLSGRTLAEVVDLDTGRKNGEEKRGKKNGDTLLI